MKHVLQLGLDSDHENLERDRETVMHLVAEIEATGDGVESERPSMSVMFVLDVSHSMSGEPLRQVIRSTQRLIEMLKPKDRAGVVAFSSNASVVAPVEEITPQSRSRMCNAVKRMQTESWTNLQAGLEAATRALPSRRPHERHVLLVLSDGMPNRGISSPDGLAAMASALRPAVSISTLGFGPHHEEPVLSAIAEAGVGTYRYVRDPALSHLQFAAALGTQGDIVADGIELCVTPGDNSQVLAIIGHNRTRFARGGVIIDVPDLVSGATHQLAARLSVKVGRECRSEPVAHVSLRYHPAGSSGTAEIEHRLVVPVTRSASAMSTPALHKVLVLRAEEERRKARDLADRGQFRGASETLRSAAEMIAQVPGFDKANGSALAEAWDQLHDDADLFDQRPDEQAYREFRRGQQLGVGGNVFAGASIPRAIDSRRLLDDAAGPLPNAALVRVETGERFRLHKPMNVVGRSRTCDICVASSKVSRQSAAIVAEGGRFWVEDLGSANGVWMHGSKISKEPLAHGDVLIIGDNALRYESLG